MSFDLLAFGVLPFGNLSSHLHSFLQEHDGHEAEDEGPNDGNENSGHGSDDSALNKVSSQLAAQGEGQEVRKGLEQRILAQSMNCLYSGQ